MPRLAELLFAKKDVKSCKSYSYFCSKIFENTLATTVNEFVIKKLVKLTMLWATGPWIEVFKILGE